MKRHLFLLILITLISKVSHGQSFSGDTNWVTTPDNKLHFTVTPSYPGGDSGFFSDLIASIDSLNMQFSKNGTVEASFIIDESGEITNVVILKSGGKRLDKLVKYALRRMKKFVPAIMDGKPVPTTMKVPVRFDD